MKNAEIEIGKVTESGAGWATVEVSPSGFCSHCELAGVCVPAASGKRIIKVANPLGASSGQHVRIELASSTFLLASFLAYILPLMGLFAGAFIGYYSASEDTAGELRGTVGAILGLAAGLFVSRLSGQRLENRGKITPSIIGIVPEEEEKEHHNDDREHFR